jgi:hypothetical protein
VGGIKRAKTEKHREWEAVKSCQALNGRESVGYKRIAVIIHIVAWLASFPSELEQSYIRVSTWPIPLSNISGKVTI